MTASIRPITENDKAPWLRLWQHYLDHHDHQLSPEVTETTWERMLDDTVPTFALVAEQGGDVVGCAICQQQIGTWSAKPLYYLEDLFVDPELRGQGIGRTLIEAVIERGRFDGAYRIYWRAEAFNTKAQALYDRLAPRDERIYYEVDLD